MSRARDLADLLDANGDVDVGALDNVPAADVVNDTTPQLGGDLQSNGNDVVFADNDKAIFGGELQIYSDATHARIVENGTGQLKVQGNNMQLLTSDGASTYLEGNASTGAVTLYHASNSPRLATTSTGVDVTGGLNTTGNVGIGDITPLDKVHIYESVNSATATQLLLQNEGAGSNAAGIAFQVSNSTETTGLAPKAGIVFERQLANGRGSLKFFNDGVNDTNPFSAADEVMSINSSGTVTATAFVGDGSGLTGLSSVASSTSALGTYILGRKSAIASAGSTHSGSQIGYSGAGGIQSGNPSGTWRLHGRIHTNSPNENAVSVFHRIS